MSERAVHYCGSVYEVIPWATTHGDVTSARLDSVSPGVTFQTWPDGLRRLVGLKPMCGAPMRSPGEARRRSDVNCKRCLRLAKKRDLRKEDRGYSARRRIPHDSEAARAADGGASE